MLTYGRKSEVFSTHERVFDVRISLVLIIHYGTYSAMTHGRKARGQKRRMRMTRAIKPDVERVSHLRTWEHAGTVVAEYRVGSFAR